jgi:hypothetical protein
MHGWEGEGGAVQALLLCIALTSALEHGRGKSARKGDSFVAPPFFPADCDMAFILLLWQ